MRAGKRESEQRRFHNTSPASINFLKSTIETLKKGSKLTIKTPERRHMERFAKKVNSHKPQHFSIILMPMPPPFRDTNAEISKWSPKHYFPDKTKH